MSTLLIIVTCFTVLFLVFAVVVQLLDVKHRQERAQRNTLHMTLFGRQQNLAHKARMQRYVHFNAKL